MNYTDRLNKTNEKFNSLNFEVGDIFTEMLSHWVYIVGIDKDDKLIVFEGHPSPNNLDNLSLNQYTKEEFKKKCSYHSIEGYWVTYFDTTLEYLDQFKETYKLKPNGDRKTKILNILLDLAS